MRYYFLAFVLTLVFILPWFVMNYPGEFNFLADSVIQEWNELAAVVVHNPKTVAGLQSTYNTLSPANPTKIKILLVPGHEPDLGGAEYGAVKEREMTVELASYLREFLSDDPHYDIVTTRDRNGWNPLFENYFKKDWNAIISWQQAHKNEISDLVSVGKYKPSEPFVVHNDAPQDVAYRLYGIDKWSNENDVDIMIHIHFNNYPRANGGAPGKYTGFAIYIPEKKYFNSTTTDALAQSVFKRLSKYNPISNLPGEENGIVPDEDLIAVGSYNSVDAASMLIEYGYIYEPQFNNPELRGAALRDLAYQTYLGLQDFFDPTSSLRLSKVYDTLFLPHVWNDSLMAKNASGTDVYSLQTALISNGSYPPAMTSFNDCPRTGRIGPCTRTAIDGFQRKNGIAGEKGKIGPKTIEALNKEFGS